MRLLLPLLLLAACEHVDAQPVQQRDKPPAPRKLRVAWGKIVEQTPSCFYFSGHRGRDIQLTGTATVATSGTEVTINFQQTTFRGTLTDGGFEVSRRGRHEFGGKWTVDEKIRGTFKGNGVVARYHYEECEDGTKCPGVCTIDAELSLEP